MAKKEKKVKKIYFKVKDEWLHLPVVEKEKRKAKAGVVRCYLCAVNPETGKKISKEVPPPVFDRFNIA